MNLFPDNEMRKQFGCKEVPTLKISLIENDKIVYEIILDSLTYYYYSFGKEKYLRFEVATINDEDYAVLVSKNYDRCIVETRNYWRSAKTGEDEIIETPAQVYDEFNLVYRLRNDGEPTRWEFTFKNGNN